MSTSDNTCWSLKPRTSGSARPAIDPAVAPYLADTDPLVREAAVGAAGHLLRNPDLLTDPDPAIRACAALAPPMTRAPRPSFWMLCRTRMPRTTGSTPKSFDVGHRCSAPESTAAAAPW